MLESHQDRIDSGSLKVAGAWNSRTPTTLLIVNHINLPSRKRALMLWSVDDASLEWYMSGYQGGDSKKVWKGSELCTCWE